MGIAGIVAIVAFKVNPSSSCLANLASWVAVTIASSYSAASSYLVATDSRATSDCIASFELTASSTSASSATTTGIADHPSSSFATAIAIAS